MSRTAESRSSQRRRWLGVGASALLALTLAGVWLARHTPVAHGDARALASPAAFATDDAAIPDDVVLREQLENAVDLRRREDFDRVLDARDPGELIEHATLTGGVASTARVLGIDTLFIVGDELFGYLFRPENGWGSGGADRNAIDYTPRLRRVQLGAGRRPRRVRLLQLPLEGRPRRRRHADAERVPARRRRAHRAARISAIRRTSSASARSRCLAREMSAELRAQAATRRASARRRKDTASSSR